MKEIDITRERFKEAKKLFKTIKQECEAEVVSWFWASSDLYSLEPYYYERNKYSRGKALKEEPAKKENKCQYGANSNGDIVVERNFCLEEYFYEIFYKRTSDLVEKFRYDYADKHLVWVERYWLSDGQVIEQHFCDEDKIRIVETYEYHNNKLIKSFRDGSYGKSTFLYEYSEIGEIVQILWNNKPCYTKPDKKKTIKQLIELSEERLYQLTFDYLKQSAITEKLYAIALHYGNDNYFPASVAFATEQQRTEWITEKGKMANQIIWLPIEYEYNYDFYEALPKETKKLFELCNQEVSMQSKDSAARTSIARVAKRLNEQRTEFDFDTTDDFIIFATDYELADLKKNMKLIDPTFFEKVKKQLL